MPADNDNIAVVRRLYEAHGEPEIIRQLLSADVRWEVVEGFPDRLGCSAGWETEDMGQVEGKPAPPNSPIKKALIITYESPKRNHCRRDRWQSRHRF